MEIEFETKTVCGSLFIKFFQDADFKVECVEFERDLNPLNVFPFNNPNIRITLRLSKTGLKVLKGVLSEFKTSKESPIWNFIKTKSGEYLLDIHLTANQEYFFIKERQVSLRLSRKDAEYLKKVVSKKPKVEK